jgi:hypothetical protein
MNKKLILKWSKQENDWQVKYPNNAGCSLMGVLFDMIQTDKRRINWEEDLIKLLTDRGFDYKTFTITVNQIKTSINETNSNS